MITRNFISAVIPALLCSLLACNKPPELPSTGSPKIVLLGELVAEDSIYFRAAQSNPVIAGGSTKRVVIQGLEVTVQNLEGGLWNLDHQEDDLTQQEATLPYFSGNIIQAAKTYNVTAVHPTLGTATVSVPVPAPFTAQIVDTASVMFQGEPCYRVNLTLTDLPAAGNAYDIEVIQQSYTLDPAFLFNGDWLSKSEYGHIFDSLTDAGITVPEGFDSLWERKFDRIAFFCEDPFAEHVKAGKGSQKINRSIFTDEQGNGTVMQSRIYIPQLSLLPGAPGFYGFKTWVQVKSISADYFSYLKSYSQTGNDFDLDILGGKVIIKGNVQNGLGIIGGVFRRQFGFDW